MENGIEKEIEKIKERNRRVEADKAWETSKTRKAIISVLTYLVIVLFMYSAGIEMPWVNAIVPTVGFVLSTMTIGVLKGFWVRNIYKRK